MMFGLARAKRVKDLEDRLTTAESVIRQLQLEWADTYDKLRRTMMRVVKRAEREPIPQDEGEAEAATAGGNGLTPRQLEAQRHVMMRRNRGGQREV